MILVIDDSEDDVFMLRRAFEKAGISVPLVHLGDGEEAVSFLLDAESRPALLPSLLLLDLKMPRMDGFSVLSWLQTRLSLHRIPVVVLSSSVLDSDRQEAQALGALAYFIKPSDPDGYTLLAKNLAEHWLNGQVRQFS